jgi:hypothetical protein
VFLETFTRFQRVRKFGKYFVNMKQITSPFSTNIKGDGGVSFGLQRNIFLNIRKQGINRALLRLLTFWMCFISATFNGNALTHFKISLFRKMMKVSNGEV